MLFEKERPKLLNELVGRDQEVEQIKRMLKTDEGMPHLLLSGKQGTGKTTMAHAIANTEYADKHDNGNGSFSIVTNLSLKKQNFFEFNASSTRGIDFIREEIAMIAQRRALSGARHKIILLDEADNITPDAQMCLKRIMEINASNTRFILTANHPYRLIPPIISRCVQLNFEPIEMKVVAKYLKKLSVKYNMNYTDSQLIQFAKMSGGDLRLAINNLEGDVSTDSSAEFDSLSIAKIKAMPTDERIKLAFKADPDFIFGKLWEMVQEEQAWDKLTMMADCNFKMNNSVHKNLFLANLLEKF